MMVAGCIGIRGKLTLGFLWFHVESYSELLGDPDIDAPQSDGIQKNLHKREHVNSVFSFAGLSRCREEFR